MAGGAPVPIPTKDDPSTKILCIADLEKAGSAKMTPMARDFFNSGSTDQVTLRENSTAYFKYRLRPRVLVDVSSCSTTTTLWSQPCSIPLGLSPAGGQAMAHPHGETATARAAATHKIPMAISSFSNHPLAAVRHAATSVNPTALSAVQLYTMRDRAQQLSIIQEAESRGCKAILLTADSPVLGVRYNEWRNDFRTPAGLAYPLLGLSTEKLQAQTHDDGFLAMNSDAHSWAAEIPWLRSVTSMEIWIKGVLTAEDTALAVHTGCEGIVVSNHGGRQLDQVVATLDALPECVAAARGSGLRVHVDGGVRSGSDVFKALALGAEMVWVGRPIVWGLAHSGDEGVGIMIKCFEEEFRRCMQLCGCRSVAEITKASLGIVRKDGPLARL